MKRYLWPFLALFIFAFLLAACELVDLPVSTTQSPEEAIEVAVRQYLAAQGGPADQVVVNTQLIDGDYARVEIVSTDPATPGGFTGFLKRDNGVWRTLIVGSGFDPNQIQALGIPENVLPEGWTLPGPELPAISQADISSPASGESAVSGTGFPAGDCPDPATDTLLLRHEAQGYCFLYPVGYDVNQVESGLVLFVKSILNVEAPLLSIQIEEANGRSAAEVADALIAEYPGFEIPRSEITLSGEPGILLDKLPGQDIGRRLLLVHDDRLYDFYWRPVGPDYGEISAQTEALYNMFLESFQFVPVVPGTPLQDGIECPEALAETFLFENEAQGYCLLLPAGYSTEQVNEQEMVVFVGSLMDVSHPKLFITVEDLAGRSFDQIIEELLSSAQAANPGFEPASEFGLSVDGEMSIMFDKLPGQDLSRQLLFTHQDRLYRLTFVPSDESAGQAYTEMETLYALVLDSFSFLWQD